MDTGYVLGTARFPHPADKTIDTVAHRTPEIGGRNTLRANACMYRGKCAIPI